MKQELEQQVINGFKSFDSMDLSNLFAQLSDDIETVDEISQKWNRGRSAVEANFTMLAGAVSEIKSDLSEFNVLISNEMATVTCLLMQSYKYEGNLVEIVAPTTCVLRLENGVWKFVVIHSIPFV
jgi:hypothetical protein